MEAEEAHEHANQGEGLASRIHGLAASKSLCVLRVVGRGRSLRGGTCSRNDARDERGLALLVGGPVASRLSGLLPSERRVLSRHVRITPQEIPDASVLVVEAGADFVKTGTGSSPRAVSVEDVMIIRKLSGVAEW